MHIVKFLQKIVIVLTVALICASCRYLPQLSYNPWEVVPTETQANLADIAFTGTNPKHGWIVGSDATLLETTDGGDHWQVKQLDLGEEKVRFNAISFKGSEGWIVGLPSILLHTTNEGNKWERISLNAKLPGAPYSIVALSPNTAEMTTDVGAIYQTEDGGKTWKALVEDAVGFVRSLSRSADGRYISVSAKGNFYSTWEPGSKAWEPHNRYSSKRLEKIGFGQDGRLWMIARGGELRFTDPEDIQAWGDPVNPEYSTSWGFLDLAYRTPEEIWVSGGSGNLLCSFDGGQTWQKDRGIENVPSNLYKIKFFDPEQGFVLGQRGTLLRYQGSTPEAA
ncbi:Ycf48-like protein [Planktothrix tepida]|uniref:Photosystem II assembly protein Ycf48 n=2 Tax=Planktothrix TaxID=54304 RepID=A0A1J1LH67_9CYAN|nr:MULTISPECIES: photosynthesis system II assembly factor Ycf48 [Planktothrix]CAD5927769.1 Ycf48-like protein [Planktothrix tepida]CAD5980548.1 Ycf48-like protein [Planktothrix pseudagardhii]CUR31378.1 Ycf48-like protein [Planktothrix tepida PCC 9214]